MTHSSVARASFAGLFLCMCHNGHQLFVGYHSKIFRGQEATRKKKLCPGVLLGKMPKKLAFHIINVSKSKDLLQVKFKKLILFKSGCVISPTTFQTIWETVLAIF